ncbi:nucleolin 1 isoform X2 [Capsella rubella]|uniref:nucleolin 1 isoform X2 n=1 Tax=Capsella rubella TaxID=81985 RepID=UPI000CD49C2E|nr:nucleolin 1 isoform X2 [Capsella rubella]
MDESAIKGLDLSDSGADAPRIFSTISVEGYDTWLPKYYIELALEKHFSSCGEIILIYVPTDFEMRLLKSVAFVRFEGGAAEEEALKLNGTDAGGWTATVKPAPSQTQFGDDPWCVDPNCADPLCPDFWCPSPLNDKKHEICVTGFDASLPKIDLQMALCKHFSSCGEFSLPSS